MIRSVLGVVALSLCLNAGSATAESTSGIGSKIEKASKKARAGTVKVIDKTTKALKHAGKKTAAALDKAGHKTGQALNKPAKKTKQWVQEKSR